MFFSFHRTFFIIVAIGLTFSVFAQPGRDSTRSLPGSFRSSSNGGPKPYREVITDKAKTDDGLFAVHKLDDKYYFEIPDKLLGRDIMVVNRITKSSINAPKSLEDMQATKSMNQ